MRVSRIITVAIVLFAFAAAGGNAAAQQCPKGKLRLYTSWPMQGAMLPEGTGMKNGIDLAVSEVGGVVAGHCLEVVNLDDASPQTGKWDGAVEAENANKAVGDPLAIVYIGTYNSGAAKKIGLPVVANEGIDWKQPDQKPVLTKIRASGADLVYLGGVIETGAQVIIRQMKEVGLVAPRTRFMGPDGLLEEELLKSATCDAALGTDMRLTFAGLPFEKMRGVGAKTYETYKAKFGKEPTSYALYAAEGGRVIIDAIKRAAPAIEKAKDVTEKREAVRKAIAATKNFEGINGKWSFDENGDVDYDTMSGFKAVKADTPLGCKFQFETILE